jgi:hypothetical protein
MSLCLESRWRARLSRCILTAMEEIVKLLQALGTQIQPHYRWATYRSFLA